jgi:hypothetical protein
MKGQLRGNAKNVHRTPVKKEQKNASYVLRTQMETTRAGLVRKILEFAYS